MKVEGYRILCTLTQDLGDEVYATDYEAQSVLENYPMTEFTIVRSDGSKPEWTDSDDARR